MSYFLMYDLFINVNNDLLIFPINDFKWLSLILLSLLDAYLCSILVLTF